MRGLATLSGALASLLTVLIGGFIQTGFLMPSITFPPNVMTLTSTWQVPLLLICSLVCGPKAGVIAAISYLTIGLSQLPVFNDGGGIGYLFNPGFGYLVGFIPAAWISGRLAQRTDVNQPIQLSLCALGGLFTLQFCGVINLVRGAILNNWTESFPKLLFIYTIGPLPAQIALCACVGILAFPLRLLLFIE